MINGKKYIFEKHLGDDGEVRSVVFNDKRRIIKEHKVPRAKRNIIGKKLHKVLRDRSNQQDASKKIKVNIALDLPEEDAEEAPSWGEVEIENDIVVRMTLDGEDVWEAEFEEHHERKARARNKRAVGRRKAKEAHLLALGKQHGFEEHVAVQRAIESTSSSVTLELTAEEIEALGRANDGMISGIELFQEPENEITEAMDATSISTHALPYWYFRGDGVGIYMTEAYGCPNESRLTNYTRLSGSEDYHSRMVGAVLRAVSPDSGIYCRDGGVLPYTHDLFRPSPPIYIVTASWGVNPLRSMSYTTLDRDWDDFVYRWWVSVFKSAGNRGNGDGYVTSPGRGLNVITVGNYNDANDTIHGQSSFVDPGTGNDKPEIVAPGTNITADGLGPESGTSLAAPHAAAFAANMTSDLKYLKYKPHLLKAKLLAAATDPISGGSHKVGLGGIDFATQHWRYTQYWYEGENNSFEYFDRADGSKDGFLLKRIYISSGWNVAKVALSWLTRGSYTYAHRNDAHPIGMDLDLLVRDPYGQYVASSTSWDNSYEYVEFDPTVSGYYTIKINRFANRDTDNDLRVGVSVSHWYVD
jgi:hypothetical protein